MRFPSRVVDAFPQHRVWYVIPDRVAFPNRFPEQRFVLMVFLSKFPEWSGFEEIYLQLSLSYLWTG